MIRGLALTAGSASQRQRRTGCMMLIALAIGSQAMADGGADLAAAERAVRELESADVRTPAYVIELSELGRLYRASGEPVLAGQTLQKAVIQSEAVFGPDHLETAAALNNRAECALDEGDLETARLAHERALAIREKSLGKDHPVTARSLNNLGLTLLAAGDAERAQGFLERALAINDHELGKDHRGTAVSLINLARAQRARNQVDAAISGLERAREIRRKIHGPREPSVAVVGRLLAEALLEKGRPADAERMLDDAVAVLRESLGEDHPDTLEAIDALERASRSLDAQLAAAPGNDPRGKQRRFFVRDSLGVEWRDQLVTFPIAAAAGECVPDRVRLEGPGGEVPVQLTEVQAWPDGTVRSGRACFFVDLAAFGCDTYVMRFDGGLRGPDEARKSDLAVDRGGDALIVRGRYIGAEFNVAAAQGAAIAPAPLSAMIGPDGKRFGGGELYGPEAAQNVEAQVLATGPVLAEIKWNYLCRGGLRYELRACVGARDTAVQWDMRVRGDASTSGWRMHLNDVGDTLTYLFQKKSFSAYADDPAIASAGELDWVRRQLDAAMRPIGVAPWYQQYFDDQQTLVFLESAATGQTRYVLLRDAGAWVEPRWPKRFTEAYPGRLAKSMPIMVAADGRVSLTAHCGTSLGGGARHWAVGVARPDQLASMAALMSKTKDMPSSLVLGKWLEPTLCDLLDSRRLDRVKDFVLHWPRSGPRPRLFVTPPQIAEARRRRLPLPGPAQAPQFPTFEAFIDHLATTHDGPWYEPWHADAFAEVAFLRGDKTAAEMRMRDRVVHHLGLLGQIDRMRDAGIVAELYDGTAVTPVVSRAEARVLDAWMAYLCHVYADPNVISYERGYHPAPPNITIAYVLSLGICACAIPDHPLARGWVADVMKKVRFWLDEELGPEGEWFEGGHYDHVTLAQFIAFAVAMRNAGFEDLAADPRLKRFAECLAEHATPPDPMRDGKRVTPPLGRRVAGLAWSLSGLMGRLNAESDPGFAARMQWAWNAGRNSYRFPDDRLAGMEMLLLDPARPARPPVWSSRRFPRSDVVFRDRVGRVDESYLLLPTQWHEALAPLQVGSVVKWFAHGAPLGGAFSDGDVDRHQLLASHVVPACAPADSSAWQERAHIGTKGTVSAVVLDSLADYLDATFTTPFPPLQGGLQSAAPGSEMPATMPAWPPVAREGVGPAEWRRQVLFVKATAAHTPAYVVMRDTVLSDTPTMWLFWTLTRGIGSPDAPLPELTTAARPATRLRGDRFSAAGQFGIDLDYFVAAPQDTLRHTLRWGKRQENPVPAVEEHQDLLHLQLDGRGSYLVFLCPRKPGAAAPSFTTLAPGIVRLRGDWGEDIVVLGDAPMAYRQEGIVIDAAVGVIRRTANEDQIWLGAGGRCSTPRAARSADDPARLPGKTP